MVILTVLEQVTIVCVGKVLMVNKVIHLLSKFQASPFPFPLPLPLPGKCVSCGPGVTCLFEPIFSL